MLEKIQGSWRKRIGQTKTVLGEKVREALTSVLPITLIVLILCFTIAPVPSDVLLAFLVGAVLLIVGMGLFTLGADTAMLPIGERVGAQMTKSRKLWVVILVSFLIGMIVTISEPDLQVLAGQVPGNLSGGGAAADPVSDSFERPADRLLSGNFHPDRLCS